MLILKYPLSPSNGVYTSKRILYAHVGNNVFDFNKRRFCLTKIYHTRKVDGLVATKF